MNRTITKLLFAGIAALLAIVSIVFVPPAVADEPSHGATTELTTEVPSHHAVHLSIAPHATVVIDGKPYTGETNVFVARLATQEYRVKTDDGYTVAAFTYDGETVALDDRGVFTAPAINRDGITLAVAVRKRAGGSTNVSSQQPVNTGATVTPVIGFGLALLAIGLYCAVVRSKHN